MDTNPVMASNGQPRPGRKRVPYERQSTGDPYRLLALSVVMQAIQDTRRGNGEAQAWLAVEGAFWLAGCGADIDPDHWQAWIAAGCPKPRRGGARII